MSLMDFCLTRLSSVIPHIRVLRILPATSHVKPSAFVDVVGERLGLGDVPCVVRRNLLYAANATAVTACEPDKPIALLTNLLYALLLSDSA